MGLEEGFDAAAQLRIVAAFPRQRRRPLGNGLKDALDALKVDRHVGTPVRVVALTCVNGAASCQKTLANCARFLSARPGNGHDWVEDQQAGFLAPQFPPARPAAPACLPCHPPAKPTPE